MTAGWCTGCGSLWYLEDGGWEQGPGGFFTGPKPPYCTRGPRIGEPCTPQLPVYSCQACLDDGLVNCPACGGDQFIDDHGTLCPTCGGEGQLACSCGQVPA